MAPTTVRPRTVAKHAAIIEAATTAFLGHGFDAAGMDAIALAAGVSKRTVYDHFGDKQQLFRAVVASITDRAQPILSSLSTRLGTIEDIDRELPDLAAAYALAVLQPDVVRLRRLAIREAERFPDLARDYFEQAPGAAITAFAAGFRRLARTGQLRIDDPTLAATQFAYLVLGALVDEALFLPGEPPSRRRITASARRGCETFLRAHRTPLSRPS